MPRYIAFLRAINVGGRNATMQNLRSVFESLGFSEVETFIASGNMIFSSRSTDVRALTARIEAGLKRSLGYEVKTFIRTSDEVARIANHKPFARSRLESAAMLNIGFLAEPLDATGERALMALRSEIDDFHVSGREVYWLCQTRQGDSKFSNVLFEKRLNVRVTFRGAKTVAKIAARYAPRESGSGQRRPQ